MVCRTTKMTLRFVTEMTTMAQMSQNREKNSKNFLQPEKRRSRRSRKPSTQRTKGSARCLRSCFRSTVGRSVRGAPGKVRGRRAPPGAEIRFRSRRRPRGVARRAGRWGASRWRLAWGSRRPRRRPLLRAAPAPFPRPLAGVPSPVACPARAACPLAARAPTCLTPPSSSFPRRGSAASGERPREAAEPGAGGGRRARDVAGRRARERFAGSLGFQPCSLWD